MRHHIVWNESIPFMIIERMPHNIPHPQQDRGLLHDLKQTLSYNPVSYELKHNYAPLRSIIVHI